MNVELCRKSKKQINKTIILSGSKSESNRVLIIKSLISTQFPIINLSDSDDTRAMLISLDNIKNNTNKELEINVGAAGTTMRFLTAYLSTIKDKIFILRGSERMHQRPIKILVDCLIKLGANIEYLEKSGYPPLKIEGKELNSIPLKIPANVSSQFISALMMIAPIISEGISLELEGKILSKSYIEMTLKMMEYFGVKGKFDGNFINIFRSNYRKRPFTVESDWTSASYWFGFIALSSIGSVIELKYYQEDSLQGDKENINIFKHFGVDYKFESGGKLKITKVGEAENKIKIDFTNNPDLAQTVACVAAGLNVNVLLTGLDNLTIKETNRIEALVIELKKFGIETKTNGKDYLEVFKNAYEIKGNEIIINTYEDHRMAMSFSLLSLVTDKLIINNAEVVSKSYKNFWNDFRNLGMEVKEI